MAIIFCSLINSFEFLTFSTCTQGLHNYVVVVCCRADMGVVKTNVDVLVKEGLGPRADSDLLLARDTCLALLKLCTPKTVSNLWPGFQYKYKGH